MIYAVTVCPKPIPCCNIRSNDNRPDWSTDKALICYQCYIKGIQTSSDCDITTDKLSNVIRNYEELSSSELQYVLVRTTWRRPTITARSRLPSRFRQNRTTVKKLTEGNATSSVKTILKRPFDILRQFSCPHSNPYDRKDGCQINTLKFLRPR